MRRSATNATSHDLEHLRRLIARPNFQHFRDQPDHFVRLLGGVTTCQIHLCSLARKRLRPSSGMAHGRTLKRWLGSSSWPIVRQPHFYSLLRTPVAADVKLTTGGAGWGAGLLSYPFRLLEYSRKRW